MAAYQSKIRAVQVGAETTFGTAASTLVSLRVEADSDAKLTQTAIENAIAKSGDYSLPRIIGGRGGDITLRWKIHGFSTSAPSSAPAVIDADDVSAAAFDIEMGLLASALGNLYAGGYITGTTVNKTGTPATAITASGGAELTSFQSGQALVWATGTTRRAYELAWITGNTAATPDSAALLQEARRSPQGSTIWGSYNIFGRTGTPYHTTTGITSWTVKLVGHGSDDVYICTGCYPKSCKVTINVNEAPVVEMVLGVAHWTMPGSGGGPSIPSWSYPEPQAALDWQLAIDDSSVDYPTVKSLELDFGLTSVPLMGGHSDSGVEGFEIVQRVPRLTMALHANAGFVTAFQAQEQLPVTFQCGSQPGKIFGFALPGARVVEMPARGDQDGLTIMDMVMEGCLYTGDSGSDDTKPYDSPIKLAFA